MVQPALPGSSGSRHREWGGRSKEGIMQVALTIAGSDPSGGAGLQADLKTFHQLGVYGTTAVTLLTVQNTRSVRLVRTLEPELVIAQLDAILEDIPPAAAKTGALGNGVIVRAVAERLAREHFPIVVDPVMISKHGVPLMTDAAQSAVKEFLLPVAFLVTPNLAEAAALSGIPVDNPAAMEEAAKRIASFGPAAVLVKGGHLPGEALDLLYWKGETFRYTAPRVATKNTHGTGCTYSAAITAELAKGHDLPAAVDRAKRFITLAIQSNPGLGKGYGPVNHHVRID
jgi:hydroxymethylpyrimidine/phosphomethylpyrimidine kinase